MAKQIRVPENALPAIAALGNNVEKLPLLTKITEGLPAGKRSPETISRAFASQAGIPLTTARDIVTQLLSLHDLRYTFGMSASETYDAITEALVAEASPKWQTENLEKWKSGRPAIQPLLDPAHALSVVQKNSRLTYAHQNVLYNASILSDVRPVFDDAAQDIRQFTITFMLELEYFDGTERRQMFAALDASDVAKLKKACERAEVKAETLRKKLQAMSCLVAVSGEDTDA